jgi:hypothetical protein
MFTLVRGATSRSCFLLHYAGALNSFPYCSRRHFLVFSEPRLDAASLDVVRSSFDTRMRSAPETEVCLLISRLAVFGSHNEATWSSSCRVAQPMSPGEAGRSEHAAAPRALQCPLHSWGVIWTRKREVLAIWRQVLGPLLMRLDFGGARHAACVISRPTWVALGDKKRRRGSYSTRGQSKNVKGRLVSRCGCAQNERGCRPRQGTPRYFTQRLAQPYGQK